MEYIIGDLRKDNALQASSEQIDNWKHFKSLFNINNDKLSFTEWIDLLDNGLGGLFFGKLKKVVTPARLCNISSIILC